MSEREGELQAQLHRNLSHRTLLDVPAVSQSAVMAAEISASFVLVFTSLWLLALCQDIKNVTVTKGKEATLRCEGPKGAIMIIQWSKPGLEKGPYVFLYHSEKIHKSYQLSSYHDRVTLIDAKMENGNATIVLKNVTDNDEGIYECLISVDSTGRKRRNEPKLTSIINLRVTNPGGGGGNDGGKDDEIFHGHLGLLVGLVVCGVIVVGLLGFTVRKKLMRKNSEQPAAVAAGEQDPLEKSNSKKDECHVNVTLN